MRNLFGFRHDFDSSNPAISCPGRPKISIIDDGYGFRIPIAFVRAGLPSPYGLIRSMAAVAGSCRPGGAHDPGKPVRTGEASTKGAQL